MRSVSALFALVFAFLLPTAAFATVSVQIDLSSQTMRVASGASGEAYTWTISSARSGFVTPHGTYRTQRLEVMHYSHKYHMSPMPHSIFFRGGYAIHGTYSVAELGRPASHGCVRLAPANAAKLYAMVKREGARIGISGTPPLGKTMVARARARAADPEAVAYRRQAEPAALGYAPIRGYEAPMRVWIADPSGGRK